MFQIPIQIGCLLIVLRHVFTFVQSGIVEESRPEQTDILLPQGRQQRQFLYQGVSGVDIEQYIHQIHLCLSVVRAQMVLHHQQALNDSIVLVVFYRLRVIDILLLSLCPFLMESRMLQQSDIFLRNLHLTIHQGTARHIFQIFGSPAIFHTILQTPSVAIVCLTVCIIDGRAYNLRYFDRHGRIGHLATCPIVIHIVALTPQAEQCQVLHHHNGTCGLLLEVSGCPKHTLPIALLHSTTHLQFLLEVVVTIPEVMHAPPNHGQ